MSCMMRAHAARATTPAPIAGRATRRAAMKVTTTTTVVRAVSDASSVEANGGDAAPAPPALESEVGVDVALWGLCVRARTRCAFRARCAVCARDECGDRGRGDPIHSRRFGARRRVMYEREERVFSSDAARMDDVGGCIFACAWCFGR